MNTNFCSAYDIPKRIFKCCSIRDKEVFVFLNIYFFTVLTIIIFAALYMIEIPSPSIVITEKYTINLK